MVGLIRPHSFHGLNGSRSGLVPQLQQVTVAGALGASRVLRTSRSRLTRVRGSSGGSLPAAPYDRDSRQWPLLPWYDRRTGTTSAKARRWRQRFNTEASTRPWTLLSTSRLLMGHHRRSVSRTISPRGDGGRSIKVRQIALLWLHLRRRRNTLRGTRRHLGALLSGLALALLVSIDVLFVGLLVWHGSRWWTPRALAISACLGAVSLGVGSLERGVVPALVGMIAPLSLLWYFTMAEMVLDSARQTRASDQILRSRPVKWWTLITANLAPHAI